MTLNLREIRYWLVRNCPRSYCWVIMGKLDDMLNHIGRICYNVEGRVISPDEITLSRATLKYVYAVHMTNDMLVALIEAKDGTVYVIKNKNKNIQRPEEPEPAVATSVTDTAEVAEEKFELIREIERLYQQQLKLQEQEGQIAETELEKEIAQLPIENIISVESVIIKAPDLISAINRGITKANSKLLNIPKTAKMHLKAKESKRLQDILAIDFIDIGDDDSQMLNLWHGFLDMTRENNKTLIDLSGNYTITPRLLSMTDPQRATHIQEIIFYQNVQLGKFDWLEKFPNLKTLNFWYCHQIKNSTIDKICKTVKNLDCINIHHCFHINSRVLIPLLTKTNVTKICLDSPVLICQNSPHQGLITYHEWLGINNHSLKHLYINSDNLTNDVICDIVEGCLSLETFVMNTLVLQRLNENIIEGIEAETITFQSSQDVKMGFTVNRALKFKNLLRNTYEVAFSDSMMDLMKRHEEESELTNLEELEAELLLEIEAEFDKTH